MDQPNNGSQISPVIIQMHPADNVAVVANDGGLASGTKLSDGLVLQERIPQGHKVALANLAAGQPVRRYNVIIGYAKDDIAAGSWIHENRLRLPEPPSLDDLPIATATPACAPPLEGYTFEGFRNPDGSVGTRNILAISSTVQCVAGVIEFAVKRIKDKLLPNFPNVDDVISLEHTYGCGVAIDAPGSEVPIRTLRHLAQNPNFGGEVMLVSLGCEKLQPERLMPAGSIEIHREQLGTINDTRWGDLDVVCLQDKEHIGFDSMIEHIMLQAEQHLRRLNARKRETVPASELVVGMQCGGSDAFSGITANPVLGFASDLLVRAGATVMFSEVTEVRDGIAQLTSRATTPRVAQKLIEHMQWFDEYLARGGVDRSANTSPGNKRGGLSNIVEKAMGSISKSGTAPIAGVLGPGDRLNGQRGLIFNASPASDFICGTLQLAAGMNLHIFTTGRGTPYGLAQCPVIKVATRSDLARRWHDLMDVNAGLVADGQQTIESLGWELFHLILEVASGKQTWAEHWKLHNSLALFNPAPVT
ncbi:galactarate dehydratase [Orrella daihaiensis]|uniref:Galactarate dehydratase n=1 Tax=Orrella daihaiensis TaxID=2782176 RepID=A0ABY4ALX1_9BURK|nr:galactarate dehydratase [Orrella daihaiensis]UOD50636.1 galactarate dehydratase [Orrella daihaiensis]